VKRRVSIIVISLILLGSVFAFAGKWYQKSSLMPGTYLLIYHDNDGMANWEGFVDWAARHDKTPQIDVQMWLYGMKFKISKEYTTESLLKFLNNDPATTKDDNPVLFVEEEGGWRQIPLPCRWSTGNTEL
jgi:hypothetical protein